MSTQDELKKELDKLNAQRKQSNVDIEALQENRNKLDAEHSALEAEIAKEAKLKMKIGDMFLGVLTKKPILIIQIGGATRGVYEDGEEICFQDDEYAEEVLLFNSFATLKRNESKEIEQ